MSVTRLYKRLPSDAGVTFEGFGNIVLPTRSIVKDQLDNFIQLCLNSNKTALRVLIGEWGEGKTDAFYRYLLPITQNNEHHSFFVSASTLANSYDVPKIKELNQNTPLSSLRFLNTVFSSINAENEYGDLFPGLNEFDTANEYVEATLINLLNEDENRIFIFIDEFEELLLDPEKLNLIISGLKETINGRYPLISESGEYPGRIHFIVAATPDAFYRLQVDDDTALIFGGLGRRTGVIDLPPIRKKEGFEFLWKLLEYCYDYSLPAVTPIDNYGIFQSLYRITLGNPGNIVSKFTRLLNAARIDEHEMQIIDGDNFTNFLENETVFVYGGSTPCIETELYSQILSIIKDQNDPRVGDACVDIFKMLSSGIKPYSLSEIENKVNRKDVKVLINQINEDIRSRLGVEKSILNVSKLRDEKNFEDIVKVFDKYITKEDDDRIIKISNYSESLSLFEDRLLSFEIRENEIIGNYYLPTEKRSIEAFFDGVEDDASIEVRNMITRRLTDESEYYLISESILQQIYPYPIPKEMEFVKNRELRMKIWRDVTRNLSENYERYVMPAVFNLLNISANLEIRDTQVYWNEYEIRNMAYDESSINCLFYSVNGDVKVTDIDNLDLIVKSQSPPILCVLLIYTGNITPSAEESIKNKMMDEGGNNIIFKLQLHPTLIKKILSIYRATKESDSRDFNVTLYDAIMKRIILQDLNFIENYDAWLKIQDDKGRIIKNLLVESTINIKDLLDTLKYYINYSEIKSSPSDLYDLNVSELGKYIIYNSRIGLVPDVEKPKFTRVSMDLISNSFIRKENGDYIINKTKIEYNILNILNNKNRLDESEIESYFITNNKQMLSKFYIPLLAYKGLIIKDNNNYMLNNRSLVTNKVELTYAKLKPLFSNDDYISNGYLFMSKQREVKLITLNDYYEFLTGLYNICNKLPISEGDVYLQKCVLFEAMSQHFEKEYLPLFRNTNSKLEEILVNSVSKEKQFRSDIEDLSESFYKWLKVEFDYSKVESYVKLKKEYVRIEDESSMDYDYIETGVNNFTDEEIKLFNFNKEPIDAYNFNPKLYFMTNVFEEIESIIKLNDVKISKMKGDFDHFDNSLRTIRNKISRIDVDDESKISIKMLELINNLTKDIIPDIDAMAYDSITLDTLNDILGANISDINKDLMSLDSLVGFVPRIDKNEKEMNDLYEDYVRYYDDLKDKYDVGKFFDVIEKFKSDIDNTSSEYLEYSVSIVIDDLDDVVNMLNKINVDIINLKANYLAALKDLQYSWNVFRLNITNINENTLMMIDFLIEKYDVDFSPVINISNLLKERVNYDEVQKIEYSISEIEELVNILKESFYNIIKEIMDEKMYLILEATIKILNDRRVDWIPTNELIEQIKDNTTLDFELIETNLSKLVSQGFFKDGVSLSI